MRTVTSHLLLSAIAISFSTSVARAEIAWQDNLRAAHAKAQAENKLLLLHFYSDNCVWCDRLEAGAFKAPNVGNAVSHDYVPVKIHANKNPQLVEMFKVTKFPTDVIVTTAGKTLSHSVSPQVPEKYVAMLQSAVPKNLPTQPAGASPNTSTPQAIAATPNPQAAKQELDPSMMPQAIPSPTAPPNSGVSTGQPTINKLAQQLPPSPQVPVQDGGDLSLPQQIPANTVAVDAKTPGAFMGGAKGYLAGARTDAMTLGMPAQLEDNPSDTPSELEETVVDSIAATPPQSKSSVLSRVADAPAPKPAGVQNDSTEKASVKKTTGVNQPELAMEGFCAVTVIKEDRWVEGKPDYGVIHLGKLYLFASAEAMETFLAEPVIYTPVLNEIDVVRFFEERRIVPGKREWGLKDPTYNRMFFFADEAAMNHFWNEYERYTDAAIGVMDQAVKDANPGI